MNHYWQVQTQPTQHAAFYGEQPRYYEPVDFPDEPITPKSPPPSLSLRKRRASHNAVERRRRDTITEKIKELDSIIPEDFYEPGTSTLSTSEKHYKSAVLRRSCEYMRHLELQLQQAEQNQTLLLQRLALFEGHAPAAHGGGVSPRGSVAAAVKQEPLYLENIE